MKGFASLGRDFGKLGEGTPANLRYWQPFTQLPGLVAIWPMENSSPLLDRSGNGCVLTQSGNPAFTQTPTGGKYADKLAADYWYANDDAWNSITGELFIAGWAKHDAIASAQETYAAKWTATGNQRCFAMFRDATGKLQFEVTPDGTGAAAKAVGSAAPYTTSWVFVAGRYVPSTSLTCWVNNVSLYNLTTIPAGTLDGTGRVELGAWNGGTSGMVGNMGVFALYNIAPSDEQVTALYNATVKYYPP
jgi:hypothetical protein